MIFAKLKSDRRGDAKQEALNYEEVKMLG